MSVSFAKYEGLGNDFIIVERDAVLALSPTIGSAINSAQAQALCDRHLGIGADGVLLTGLAAGRPFMRVINADGSKPEMCGNGLRCVALYLVQRGLVNESTFEIDTDAGVHEVSVSKIGAGKASEAHGAQVRVVMRPASLAANAVLKDGVLKVGVQRDDVLEHLDRPFEVDGRQLSFSMVSMGNPHAVTFDALPDLVDTLGPRIERDARFREGANVGFATLRAPDVIDLRVWERGCGFTRACGTGACAAAVAAVETGRAPRDRAITVNLPGGALSIRVGERTAHGAVPVEMTGPARRVFEGQLAWPREIHP